MFKRSVAAVLFVACVLPAVIVAQAQAQTAGALISNADWVKAFPPFRMIGNVHWIGTYDLSTYLITTPQGHILINTGLAQTVSQITANVTQLGFKVEDIRILTATHGHFDHVAGLAQLKKLTKAQVDRKLKNGDTIKLGDVVLTAHHHPGHTKGATSFTLNITEGGKTYRVGIMNMGSINPGVTVRGMPAYPTIGDDYARTFREQKALTVDVFLASHASQFKMHDKYKPGDAYQVDRFVDPAGYRAAVDDLEMTYRKQMAQESAR